MTGYNKLQTEIATGRLTLPVVILICLFLWGASIHSWNELISFISCALTGYMMIEINTAFTLIRTRTMLHVSLFGFIISACMFLHPFHISNLVPPAFIMLCSNYSAATNPDRHRGTSFIPFSLSDSVVWLFHNYCISLLCSISV